MTEDTTTDLELSGDEAAEELKSIMLDRDAGVLTAVQVRRQMGLVQSLMRDVLVNGVHYGVPEGFPPDAKPFLYDAGSQKIRLIFNLRAEYEIVEKHQGEKFLGYVVRARLFDRGTGQLVGEGMGACNSRERKYRWRTVPDFKAQPGDREAAVAITKKSNQHGEYEVFKIENDPWDFQQTILAMAQVRASKKATRDALAASDVLAIDDDLAGDLIEEASFEDVTDQRNAARAKDKVDQVKQAARAGADQDLTPSYPEHVTNLAPIAQQWKDATGKSVGDFKGIVHQATKGRTSQYTEITEEEADLLTQLLQDEISEQPDNRG